MHCYSEHHCYIPVIVLSGHTFPQHGKPGWGGLYKNIKFSKTEYLFRIIIDSLILNIILFLIIFFQTRVYIHIYINIYVWRERERERYSRLYILHSIFEKQAHYYYCYLLLTLIYWIISRMRLMTNTNN